MVFAVTAIDTPTGTKLLGLGVSAYNDSHEQDEPIANPNVFVCNIDEHPKHRGGRQSLLNDNREIPIYLEEERMPYTYVHEPTTEKIQTLPIVQAVSFQLNALEKSTNQIKADQNMKIQFNKDEDCDFKLQTEISKCTR